MMNIVLSAFFFSMFLANVSITGGLLGILNGIVCFLIFIGFLFSPEKKNKKA